MPIRRLEKTYTGTTSTIGGDELAASTIPVKPHIQPGVLQPAVAGKLLNGANHSGAYGTAQTQSGGDGHSYYYTDIKGSKPIKDPRIGAHFGSQRYITSSIQLLEQETAIHGEKVYSIDGREWMRGSSVTSGLHTFNSSRGQGLAFTAAPATDGQFIEIVGYFNDANISMNTDTSHDVLRVTLNGGTVQSTDFAASIETKLIGRYVRSGSTINLTFNSTPTLGINTVKISNTTSKEIIFYAVELIAQDTTSTTTKSQIQIPSQNVVSYGKKFTVSGTPHYNPFAFKTDGTTAWASGAHNGTSWPVGTGSSANIDTATSLGLENWKHGTDYYKPYNGGRVVWWIDSSGTLKCSVNMMPPNARSYANSASLTNATAKANASIANNTFYPTMEAGAMDHSQAEVAKTFNFREFGNGSANAGTGAVTWADASMLASDVFPSGGTSYVMDDGLTSQSGSTRMYGKAVNATAADTSVYWTFIGTGVSFKNASSTASEKVINIGQNLPYGTHIFEMKRKSNNALTETYLDSIHLNSNGLDLGGLIPSLEDISYHQPKMPPIPDDACIIADYMLMADFVSIPDNTIVDISKITKGVRRISCSRDVFTSGAATSFQRGSVNAQFDADGFRQYFNTSSGFFELPYFGTSPVFRSATWDDRTNNATFKINGTDVTTSSSGTNHSGTQVLRSWFSGTHGFSSDNNGTFTTYVSNTSNGGVAWASVEGIILGQNTVRITCNSSDYLTFNGFDVASPIHTSSHYQTFETPFLHELVGGDRNMEQTNLVVTSDGKTWDEVTRDTSYIGNLVAYMTTNTAFADSATVIFDDWRGTQTPAAGPLFNKHFAIAHDRLICLTDGQYTIWAQTIARVSGTAEATPHIFVNGTIRSRGYTSGSNHSQAGISHTEQLKRGDYVQIKGGWYVDTRYSNAHIIKLS